MEKPWDIDSIALPWIRQSSSPVDKKGNVACIPKWKARDGKVCIRICCLWGALGCVFDGRRFTKALCRLVWAYFYEALVG